MTAEWFSEDWLGLPWSDWISLNLPDLSQIPREGGLYRIRPVGESCLAYIGQTGRGLRERLRALALCTYQLEMPFNDPHTAAPGLWAYRVECGWGYECSAAKPDNRAKRHLRGYEDRLLWNYRVQSGKSTLCNYGRFHPAYSRPGNRLTGRRGEKLAQLKPEVDCAPPLVLSGQPKDDNWMGLEWRPYELPVPRGAGLYKILDPDTGVLLYIGETVDIRQRLHMHERRFGLHVKFAYHKLPEQCASITRHELESDLLGSYYQTFGELPRYQYGDPGEDAASHDT